MSSVRWPSVGGSTTVVGVVDCEERALGIPLSRGFRACRFGLSAYHDTGRVRRCQVGIFRGSHFSPRHIPHPTHVIPATHPVTLRGPGVPMNTSSDAGRGGEWGNAKTQGRKEKGIPAYAGMTGGGAGYDGGFPPTRE